MLAARFERCWQANSTFSPFRGRIPPNCGMPMQPVSFKRHRFPPDGIRLAVWLYLRFTHSFRDVEEMRMQRGIEASHETVRSWTLKLGRSFARNLQRSRPTPTGRWLCSANIRSAAN